MIKIGLTGPMGSGKTYIIKQFEKLGVPIFISDDVAKKIINSNIDLRKKICGEFGNIYNEDGEIIPTLLREIVYVSGGESKLEILNNLVHPYVYEEYHKFCNYNKDKFYTIAESAIMFETNMVKYLDDIIYVLVDEDTRIKRTYERSGFSKEEYKQRMKSQLPEEYKLKMSKFIIRNNINDDVVSQIQEINKTLY